MTIITLNAPADIAGQMKLTVCRADQEETVDVAIKFHGIIAVVAMKRGDWQHLADAAASASGKE